MKSKGHKSLAKKKTIDETIRHGLDKLVKLGVDFNSAASVLVGKLSEQFGKGRETDLAVIFSLGRVNDLAALAALGEIEGQTTDKETKKEIKRALFKLSQRGFEVPRPVSGEAKPAAPLFGRSTDIEAFMSAVDGGG